MHYEAKLCTETQRQLWKLFLTSARLPSTKIFVDSAQKTCSLNYVGTLVFSRVLQQMKIARVPNQRNGRNPQNASGIRLRLQSPGKNGCFFCYEKREKANVSTMFTLQTHERGIHLVMEFITFLTSSKTRLWIPVIYKHPFVHLSSALFGLVLFY